MVDKLERVLGGGALALVPQPLDRIYQQIFGIDFSGNLSDVKWDRLVLVLRAMEHHMPQSKEICKMASTCFIEPLILDRPFPPTPASQFLAEGRFRTTAEAVKELQAKMPLWQMLSVEADT